MNRRPLRCGKPICKDFRSEPCDIAPRMEEDEPRAFASRTGSREPNTMTIIEDINIQLEALKLLPLNPEQVECLLDPTRLDEAAGMLQDLRDRCGVRLSLPACHDFGPVLEEEEQAREEAEMQAATYDAVCLEAMSTDDGRSYGGSEYRVIRFKGPNAALAAACYPGAVAYWVDGREYEGD